MSTASNPESCLVVFGDRKTLRIVENELEKVLREFRMNVERLKEPVKLPPLPDDDPE